LPCRQVWCWSNFTKGTPPFSQPPSTTFDNTSEGFEKAITGEGDEEKIVYEVVMKTPKGKLEAQFDSKGKFLGAEDPAAEEKDEK
jgi:hypothetical protein